MFSKYESKQIDKQMPNITGNLLKELITTYDAEKTQEASKWYQLRHVDSDKMIFLKQFYREGLKEKAGKLTSSECFQLLKIMNLYLADGPKTNLVIRRLWRCFDLYSALSIETLAAQHSGNISSLENHFELICKYPEKAANIVLAVQLLSEVKEELFVEAKKHKIVLLPCITELHEASFTNVNVLFDFALTMRELNRIGNNFTSKSFNLGEHNPDNKSFIVAVDKLIWISFQLHRAGLSLNPLVEYLNENSLHHKTFTNIHLIYEKVRRQLNKGPLTEAHVEHLWKDTNKKAMSEKDPIEKRLTPEVSSYPRLFDEKLAGTLSKSETFIIMPTRRLTI